MVEVTELKKIPGHRVDFGVARKMSLGNYGQTIVNIALILGMWVISY